MRAAIPPLLQYALKASDQSRVNSTGTSLPLPLPTIYAKIFLVSLLLKFRDIFLYENIKVAIIPTLALGQKSFSSTPM
jgi:hypothetical protein